MTPRQPSNLSLVSLAKTLLGTATGLLFCALIGGLAWLNSSDFDGRLRSVVVNLIQSKTGHDANFGDFRADLWPPGFELRNVEIRDALSQEPIVDAHRIKASVVFGGGGLTIGRITLIRPHVSLHVGPDGRIEELRGFGGPKNGALERLPWRHVYMEDGTVELFLPEGKLAVQQIEIDTTEDQEGLSASVGISLQHVNRTLSVTSNVVRLGPDHIDLSALQIDSEGLDIDGQFHWPLGEAFEGHASGLASLGELADLLAPPRSMDGTGHFDLRLFGTPGAPTLEVAAQALDLSLDVPGKLTPILHYHIDEIVLAATWTPEETAIHQARMEIEDGAITGAAQVTPDGRLEDLNVRFEALQLRPLLQAFDGAPTPWVNLIADAEIHGQGTLQPLAVDASFDLAIANLRVGDRPVQDPLAEDVLSVPKVAASGSLHLSPAGIRLEAGSFEPPRSRGILNATIGFEPRGPLNLYFDLDEADLRDFAPLGGAQLGGTGRLEGHIRGPFNALSYAGSGDIEQFSVLGIPWADHLTALLSSPDMKRLELQDARALRGETRYGGQVAMDFSPPMSMSTDLVIASGRLEDLMGMFLDLPGVTGDLSGTLELDGPVYDMDGEVRLNVPRVSLWGEQFEQGHLEGRMKQGIFTLNEARVTRREGREGLIARGRVGREWALEGELLADGIGFERLDNLADVRLPLSGNASLVTNLRGTLFEPEPNGQISVTDARYGGYAIEDSFLSFQTSKGIMHGQASILGGKTTATGSLDLWTDNAYTLESSMRELPLHVFYPYAADGSPVKAEITGVLSLSGALSDPQVTTVLEAALPEVRIAWRDHVLTTPTPWMIAVEGTAYEFQNLGLEGGGTQAHLSLSAGDQLKVDGGGVLDLDLLRAVVPGLTKANGQAQVDVYVRHDDPAGSAVVDLAVDAKLLQHESVPGTFEDVLTSMQLTENRIDLGKVTGGLGGGEVSAEGVIAASGWLPQRYDLSMNIRDAQVQWIDELPPAIGDATLAFDGPVDQLLLSGEVKVQDMTFSDRIEWEDWVVEYREAMLVDVATDYSEEPPFGLAVDIDAAETIHLRNNVADGTASAKLRVIGDTVRPGLTGTVEVEEGIAFLQDREFQIDRGLMLFNDPWTWDPDLDFVLVTDIVSREQRYRVDYQVHGPFSNWQTRTRSDPSLPQADVNALLWFGVTTEDLEEMGALPSALTQAAADLILTDFLIAGQAGDLGKELPDLFDRLDVTTGVNGRGEYSPEPRLVIEKKLPQFGDVDLRWEMNLVRPDDLYLTMDRRIGGVWSLSLWYASLQRELVLPIGGAYGTDVTARWESD